MGKWKLGSHNTRCSSVLITGQAMENIGLDIQ